MTRASAARAPWRLATLVAAIVTTLLLVVGVSVAGGAQTPPASVATVRDSTPATHGTARVTWARATRALKRGELLRADDFELVDTVIAWHRTTALPDTTRTQAGWIVRRSITAGEFLRPPSVAPAPVITMGSIVQVLWQDGGLRISMTGTATNDAALGAPVGVRIDRNRRLDGFAVGSNIVRLR